MNWPWIIFVVYFFRQFMLMSCHSDSDKMQEIEDREQESLSTDEELHTDRNLVDEKSEQISEEKHTHFNLNHGGHQTKKSRLDMEHYVRELLAGDPTDAFGTNQHHYYPTEYKDFGRRFILQYPYKERKKKMPYTSDDLKLLPVKAPPELVLRVAIKSAVEKANQKQDSYEMNEKDILRGGDYWDSLWVEEANPETVLRSFEKKTGYELGDLKNIHKQKLNSLKAKIMPGSKLYELVAVLKKTSSPRLLYVINDT